MMELEIYESPNLVEVTGPTVLPVAPRAFECPFTPEGKVSWRVWPQGRLEVFQLANRVQHQEEVHCVVMELPKHPGALTRMDLRCWAKEVEGRVERPMVLAVHEARYPCGEVACCCSHKGTQLREAQESFEGLVKQAKSVDVVIDQAFKVLPERDRRMLHRWATLEDPDKPRTPIRQKVLAAEMKVDIRQVRRILKRAQEANGAVYKQLEQIRTFRYQRTGAYEVR